MAQIINQAIFEINPGYYVNLAVSYDYYRSGANMVYKADYTLWISANSWYYNNIHVNMYMNGGHVYSADHKSSSKGWSVSGSTGWKDIGYKVGGTTPFSIAVYDTQNSSWVNYNSGNIGMVVTNANMGVYQSLNSKTPNTIKMNWSSDNTANYIWYSINDGSSWTAVGSVNASSGNYTIYGLAPNTTYNIKTRARRADTGLDNNYSGRTQVATYKAYSTVTSATVGDLTPFTCTAYCTSSNASNTSTYEYSLCNSNKSVISTYTSSVTSYSFTGLSEETTYYIRCRVKSTDSGNWSDYVYSAAFTTPADQVRAYIKADGTWKQGKVYIKDSGSWIKTKKAYVKDDSQWKIAHNS